MSLRDLMDADLGDVFLDTEELGESSTVTPLEGSGTFAWPIALADAQQSAVVADELHVLENRIEVQGQRSVYRAGTLLRTGTARDARRGDQVTLTGEHVGDWFIESAWVDLGGAQHATLVREDLFAAGGIGAQEAD